MRFLILLLALTTSALAQTSELPTMLLGKGVIHNESTRQRCKDFKKMYRKGYYSKEDLDSICNKPDALLYLGLSCVGNCSEVQGVLINLTTQQVEKTGRIIKVTRDGHAPTQKEVKSFLKALHEDFSNFQHAHMSRKEKDRQDGLGIATFCTFGGGMVAIALAGGGLPILIPVGLISVFTAEMLGRLNLGIFRPEDMVNAQDFNWSSQPKRIKRRHFWDLEQYLLTNDAKYLNIYY